MKLVGLCTGMMIGFAATCGAVHAEAPAKAPPAATVPAPETVLMLVRAHVLAVGQAVASGDYGVLRSIASARFRDLNSPAALSTAFAALHELHLDVTPVVVTTPVLTDPPSITDGKLRLYGAFPTQPIEVTFGMLLEPEGGVWKLNAVSVGARPAAKVVEVTMPMTAPSPAKTELKKPAPVSSTKAK